MICKRFELANEYPALSRNSAAPFLRCYLQENLSSPAPALIVLPGGGYWQCSEPEAEPVALAFSTIGIHTFVLNYSTVPHVYPQAMCEVAAAVDMIHRNAEEWKVDTSRIAVLGFSAGGHLAAFYSTNYDAPAVREIIDSKPVQASVLCYPVISTEAEFGHLSSLKALLGKDAPSAEEMDYFSAQKHVGPATPPAFLWHTAADTTVDVRNTLVYAEKLRENGVKFEAHIFPEGYHGISLCGAPYCDEYDKASKEKARVWVDMAKNWLINTFDI